MKKNIKTNYLITILVLVFYTLLPSCTLVNRTEIDVHTITDYDSISYQKSYITNISNRTNSLYPPRNKIIKTTNIIQHDSIVLRHYPKYIRAGIIESFGYFSNYSGKNDLGLFGLATGKYGDVPKNSFFSMGGLKIGYLEYKLQWDEDIENITIGTSMYENFYFDSKQSFSSISPLYFTKSYFLNNGIPNLTLATSLGFAYYPNTYINLTETLEYGSYAGLNIKLRVGLLNVFEDKVSMYPYLGIGFSIFDFFNKEDDMEEEWKNVKHKAWNIGLINIGINNEGMNFDLLLNKIALPYMNNNLILGTSLANINIFDNVISASVLPIYTSYRKNIFKNKIVFEPFIRFNYLPTLFVETGGELSIRINELFSLKFGLEYANGKGYNYDVNQLQMGNIVNFSKWIFYVKFGIGDRIFYPKEMYFN